MITFIDWEMVGLRFAPTHPTLACFSETSSAIQEIRFLEKIGFLNSFKSRDTQPCVSTCFSETSSVYHKLMFNQKI